MAETPIRDCELTVNETHDMVEMCDGREIDSTNCTANAERLAACWNSFRGIPTEELATLWEDIENVLDAAQPAVPAFAVHSCRRLLRLCELRREATR